MSVLMRGVDMPKNCEECNFKGECRQYWNKIREAYTRPSWCPLVEVADTPQTDLLVKTPHKSRESHEKNCENCRDKDAYDEWEGNCDECENGSMYTPQTDCGWK